MKLFRSQEQYDNWSQKLAELFGVEYSPSKYEEPITNEIYRSHDKWAFKEGNQYGKLQKGVSKSLEHREKLRLVNLGKTRSKESSEKKRQAMLGRESPNKGKILGDDWRLNMSFASKGKPKSSKHRENLGNHLNSLPELVCPHCGKSGRMAPMKRWHFDSCKLK